MSDNLKDALKRLQTIDRKRAELTEELERSLAIRELIGLSVKSTETLKAHIIKPSGVSPSGLKKGDIFRITREDGSYTDRPLNEVPKILGGTKECVLR